MIPDFCLLPSLLGDRTGSAVHGDEDIWLHLRADNPVAERDADGFAHNAGERINATRQEHRDS